MREHTASVRPMEDELEIRDLQPFRRHRDLAVGREPSGLEMDAESQPGLGGGDDENGSLNAKHVNLSSMNVSKLRRRTRVQAEFLKRSKRLRAQVRMWSSIDRRLT